MISWVAVALVVGFALFMTGRVIDAYAERRRLLALGEESTPPPSLYPRINMDACICSGSCVDACPETDVIAMIDGRPRLVQASACVGHSDCLRSCPTQAIELVLGSRDRAVEVPVASGSFETSVPGLYVAGEVTGIGLIHNAVAQGRQAARAALDGLKKHSLDHDVVVVGAGPAGLGAALEAAHRRANSVVFEKLGFGGAIFAYPRKKVVMTSPLQLPGGNSLKLRRTSKEALIEMFRSLATDAQLAIRENAEVTGIERIGEGFRVSTRAGDTTTARIVLAIGRRASPRKLGAPGEDLPHVRYLLDDPAPYQNTDVAVVGGGDSAVEAAVALAGSRARVTLVHRGRDFARCKPANRRALEDAIAAKTVTVHLETTIRRVTATHVDLSNEQQLAARTVVCCLGGELPSAWLRSVGVDVRELRGEPLASR